MSLLEGSVPATEANDIVDVDSASVSDAETVQNTNTHSSVEEETLNDSELLKGLLTDTFCQVCEAVLLFESQRVSHYEGKKHAQRVRIYLQTKRSERNKQSQECYNIVSRNVDPEKFCELCNMVFSSPVVARSHYEGKVHAKNMKKSKANPCVEVRPTAGPVVLPAGPDREGAMPTKVDQEQKETASATQSIDLSDSDKYCKLCAASFNNPTMAQQHYIGRKHLRNQSRQELLSKLGEESEHVNSLTCPVCCVTLSSVETYQAHMQGNKHHVKEKKIHDLCKSQKKVYDSFQDELADYIQVQRARGLEPKKSETAAQGKTEEEETASPQFEQHPQLPVPPMHPPRPAYLPPNWRPPFQPRTDPFAFRGRFPMQQWGPRYPPHPPPLIPGLTGRSLRRMRSPDSSSSSSYSDSSSSYSSNSTSSSSSESSSDDSRKRRRRRRKRREHVKQKRMEQDGDPESGEERGRSKKKRRREEEEDRGHAKKARKQRRNSLEEEEGPDKDKEQRKYKEKRSRKRDSSEEDEYRSQRRDTKKSQRHKEGHQRKTHKEEEAEGELSKASIGAGIDRMEGGVQSEAVETGVGEHKGERTDVKEDKPKRKKEKKKTKEKPDSGDNRTEEEKLWEEAILGIF